MPTFRRLPQPTVGFRSLPQPSVGYRTFPRMNDELQSTKFRAVVPVGFAVAFSFLR